jgi:prepilin-type N-terminal cleavage/methylation domain-containing protein
MDYLISEKGKYMKKAFTLVELVLVVVIIGIVSAVIVPRYNRSTLGEAAHQIISHIRYTQHLALMDDKHDPTDPNWFQSRWQIDFRDPSADKVYYTIYQDLNRNGSASTVVSKNEIAKNPLNPKQLLTALSTNEAVNSKEMLLSEKYGISEITFSSSCSYYGSQRISFDYLGRPLYGNPKALDGVYNDNYGTTGARLIRTTCVITLKDRDNNTKQIAIEPETGYAHIIQ